MRYAQRYVVGEHDSYGERRMGRYKWHRIEEDEVFRTTFLTAAAACRSGTSRSHGLVFV